jgi:hypothetical protein
MFTQTDSTLSGETHHPADQARTRTNSNNPRPTPSLMHRHSHRLSDSLLRQPLVNRPLVKPPTQVKPTLHSASPQILDRQIRRSVHPQALARRRPLSASPQGQVVAVRLGSLLLEHQDSASRRCQALEVPLGRPVAWEPSQRLGKLPLQVLHRHLDKLLLLVLHQHLDKLLPLASHLPLARPVLPARLTALSANRLLDRVHLDRQHSLVPTPRHLANNPNRVPLLLANRLNRDLLHRRSASKHNSRNNRIPSVKHKTHRQPPNRIRLAARRHHSLQHLVNQARPPLVRRLWARRIKIQPRNLQTHSPRTLSQRLRRQHHRPLVPRHRTRLPLRKHRHKHRHSRRNPNRLA